MPGYLNNPNLPRADYKHVFTQLELDEFRKCEYDPVYFSKKYMKIVNVDRGLIPFELYDYQERMIDTFFNNRFIITLACRQSGKTTCSVAYLLHHILFNEHTSVAILANKLATAREIMGRLKLAFEYLPAFLKIGIVKWNDGSVELSNGSKALADSTSGGSIRGKSFACVSGSSTITLKVDDEVIYIPIEDLYTAFTNSSRKTLNIPFTTTVTWDEINNGIFEQQIHEMVSRHYREPEDRHTCKNPRTEISNRTASYNSEVDGRYKRSEQYRSPLVEGACAGTSPVNEDGSSRKYTRSIGVGVFSDDVGASRQDVGNDRDRKEGTSEAIFGSPSNINDRECSVRRNKKKILDNSQRENYVSRDQRQNLKGQHRSIGGDQEATGIWSENLEGTEGTQEVEGVGRQDQQEPRKNSQNGREASWHEKVGRITSEDVRSSQGSNSLEQRITVQTAEGFKSFAGIRVTKNKRVITLSFGMNHLTCTSDHLVHTKFGWKQASDIVIGGLVTTDNGYAELTDVKENGYQDVYDLLEVEDTNSFFASGILVHNCIFLDEFAHVPNNLAEKFFASTYPTISSGEKTKVIIVSTPNGMNLYARMWKEAISGQSDYTPFSIHWSDVPGRDEAWKEQTIRNTSEQQFRQEFGAEFLGSTNTLISGTKLQTLAASNPIRTEFDDCLSVYEDPINNHTYCCTVDVAEGQGLDYSTFSIVDVTSFPYRQVAAYRNNEISPMMFPTVIYHIATRYNDAFTLVEINSIGLSVADTLHYELNYENLIKIQMEGKQGQQVSAGYTKKIAFGLKTSAQTKNIGCTNLKTLIESDKLIVVDATTIAELMTFSADKNSFKAEEGSNDDCVIPLMLLGWLTSQRYFRESSGSDVRARLQKEILDVTQDDVMPFIGYSDGLEFHEPRYSETFEAMKQKLFSEPDTGDPFENDVDKWEPAHHPNDFRNDWNWK